MLPIFAILSLTTSPFIAADYQLPPGPPVVIEEQPPVIVAPSQPRCRVVRETQHDDILDTNNYTEREECDEE